MQAIQYRADGFQYVIIITAIDCAIRPKIALVLVLCVVVYRFLALLKPTSNGKQHQPHSYKGKYFPSLMVARNGVKLQQKELAGGWVD